MFLQLVRSNNLTLLQIQTSRLRVWELVSGSSMYVSVRSLRSRPVYFQLTFGIGCFTTLPSVQMFCFYTFMGITFTYIYQLTFFTAVVAFSGEREARGLHAITMKPAMDPKVAGKPIFVFMEILDF